MCRHLQRIFAVSSSLPTITVVAGLICQAGQWLICQRRRDAAFALKWEFPGGKVKPGEAFETALRRELLEELGIDAHIGPERYRTRHHYPEQYTAELIFYEVIAFLGTPQNHVFEQIRWVPLDVLPSLDFLAGDAELITLLSPVHNHRQSHESCCSRHGSPSG
jgi:8-oxo-dGTP diphosphatase